MQMVDYAHERIRQCVKEGDCVVDATVGNGWDTLKLCEWVGEKGKVYGFDIQEDALSKTKERLKSAGYEKRAELICESHAKADEWIKEPIRAFMMNLGYLPGGDKQIMTHEASTVPAILALSKCLMSGGVGTVLIYYGHEGGLQEKEAVEKLFASMPADWGQITRMEVVNRKNSPPILYILEKK